MALFFVFSIGFYSAAAVVIDTCPLVAIVATGCVVRPSNGDPAVPTAAKVTDIPEAGHGSLPDAGVTVTSAVEVPPISLVGTTN